MELTLTPDMMLVLGLVGFTVIMLILEWVRADIVALLVLVVIGITGLMPVQQLFDGFASNAVLALIGVMIMGAGLDRTGVFARMASLILRLAGGAEGRVSLIINTMAGTLSSIIQSQALASLFLPVSSRISARTGAGQGIDLETAFLARHGIDGGLVDIGEARRRQAVLGEIEEIHRNAAALGGVGDGNGDVVRADRLRQPRRQHHFRAVGQRRGERREQRHRPLLLAVGRKELHRLHQFVRGEHGFALRRIGQAAEFHALEPELFARQQPVIDRAVTGGFGKRFPRAGGIL